MKQYKENTKGYKILTDQGYVDFAGIAFMGHKPVVRLDFEGGTYVECTYDHRFFRPGFEEVQAQELKIGDLVYGQSNNKTLTGKVDLGIRPVYDIIECQGNRFFANGILSHNCEFITEEETLVSGMVLKGLEGKQPTKVTGNIRWYDQIKANYTYVVALDPCMGTGSDNAAITVWRLPDLVQVAEWTHNKTDPRGQVSVLRQLLIELHTELQSNPDQIARPEIYWSIENNQLGEAVLVIIEDTGEERFPGDFINEPRKRRKGFTTTHRTKIEACSRLKTLLESGKIHPQSSTLISELKTYIKSGRSYQAKSGNKDDLVSSTLLAIRIISEVRNYESDLYDELGAMLETEGEDQDPMPSIFA